MADFDFDFDFAKAARDAASEDDARGEVFDAAAADDGRLVLPKFNGITEDDDDDDDNDEMEPDLFNVYDFGMIELLKREGGQLFIIPMFTSITRDPDSPITWIQTAQGSTAVVETPLEIFAKITAMMERADRARYAEMEAAQADDDPRTGFRVYNADRLVKCTECGFIVDNSLEYISNPHDADCSQFNDWEETHS